MDSFRSWKPRPPSADAHRRLFGRPPAADPGAAKAHPGRGLVHWTISSALSAAVVLATLSPASSDEAALLSREAHSLGAFSAHALTAQNTLPATTFTWTNRSLLPAIPPATHLLR